eukprot:3036625-Rhodomonas_salina.1
MRQNTALRSFPMRSALHTLRSQLMDTASTAVSKVSVISTCEKLKPNPGGHVPSSEHRRQSTQWTSSAPRTILHSPPPKHTAPPQCHQRSPFHWAGPRGPVTLQRPALAAGLRFASEGGGGGGASDKNTSPRSPTKQGGKKLSGKRKKWMKDTFDGGPVRVCEDEEEALLQLKA